MSCEIKTPHTGKDETLLLKHGPFVVLKLKSSRYKGHCELEHTDRIQQIKVEIISVALRRIFDPKLSGIHMTKVLFSLDYEITIRHRYNV